MQGASRKQSVRSATLLRGTAQDAARSRYPESGIRSPNLRSRNSAGAGASPQVLWVFVVALVLSAMVGCKQTVKVEIDQGTNDGGLGLLTSYYPAQVWGLMLGTVEPARAGLGVSGGGDTLLCRVLYRFEVGSWTAGDVTLHFYCDAMSGQPGPVDIYCTNDFGSLHDSSSPEDLGSVWAVIGAGTWCGQVTPAPHAWSEVVVADSVVAARRSGTGVLCFALRLDDETALAETWYRLGTLERAIELGTDPPHLTWAK